ncbi:DUF2207 domain-containing protein [Candidatus Roizmanbacteria bacterium]|nr:DUF2207 domain-containing protein [Candidatus Roizmanbacteria bacterium]
MKQFAIVLLFLIFFTAVIPIHAQSLSYISQFTSDITIEKDGTIQIIETIADNFEDGPGHGLWRHIPLIRKGQDNKKYKMGFTLQKIQRDGIDEPYTREDTSQEAVIRVGSSTKTYQGLHIYTIAYKVTGTLGYYENHDELYRNITGNEWPFPINAVTTTIHMPDVLPISSMAISCYTGLNGSKAHDCSYKIASNGATITTNSILHAKEGLTVAFSFPKNIIATQIPTLAQQDQSKKDNSIKWETATPGGKVRAALFILLGIGVVGCVLYWYLLLPILIARKYYKSAFSKINTVPISFDPPKTKTGRFYTPAETGMLLIQYDSPRFIVATIIDLSFRGFMKINERSKDNFYLIKEEKDINCLETFEKMLITNLFGASNEVEVNALNDNESFQSAIKDIYQAIYSEMKKEEVLPEATIYVAKQKKIALMIGAILSCNTLLFFASILSLFQTYYTPYGLSQLLIVKGLKRFLSSQERQLNFEADKQFLFERLLSYATVFGIEKIWMERFADANLTSPVWYSGYENTAFAMNSFSRSFTTSITHLSTASTIVTSSSMSGSHSSGSSGGGSGGGGGGNW